MHFSRFDNKIFEATSCASNSLLGSTVVIWPVLLTRLKSNIPRVSNSYQFNRYRYDKKVTKQKLIRSFHTNFNQRIIETGGEENGLFIPKLFQISNFNPHLLRERATPKTNLVILTKKKGLTELGCQFENHLRILILISLFSLISLNASLISPISLNASLVSPPPRLLLVSPPPFSPLSHHHHDRWRSQGSWRLEEPRFMAAGGAKVHGGLRMQVSWRLEESKFMAAGRGTRLWRRRHEFFL
ncbi:hypothetical protein YC2023_051653 [Brassica napus]